jgi:hypothetical protein
MPELQPHNKFVALRHLPQFVKTTAAVSAQAQCIHLNRSPYNAKGEKTKTKTIKFHIMKLLSICDLQRSLSSLFYLTNIICYFLPVFLLLQFARQASR